MHSILVVIHQPPKGESASARREHSSIARELRDLATDKDGAEVLTDNVLLVRGGDGLETFGEALSRAQAENLEYEVLILENMTRWKSSSD